MAKKIVVIGGGAAGCRAALLATQSGCEVELWEKEQLGGMCLNFGCIPSKMLLHDAALHEFRGGVAQDAWAQYRESIAVKTGLLRAGLRAQLGRAGVVLVEKEADAGALIGCDAAILAFGRVWAAPAQIAGKRMYDFREVFSMEHLPAHLAVIGGGTAGLELAQAFAGLGSHVTVYEMQERILPSFDAESAERYMHLCAELGIDFVLGKKVCPEDLPETDIVFTGAGNRVLSEAQLQWLHSMGVEADARGIIATKPNIYAIGDCTGKTGTAYEAEAAAERAVSHILALPCAASATKLHVVCGKYDLVAVGEMRGLCAAADCSKNGCAFALDATSASAKLYCDQSGTLTGAVLMLPHASELAGLFSAAIESGMHISKLADAAFFHPSVSTCIREAAVKLHALL